MQSIIDRYPELASEMNAFCVQERASSLQFYEKYNRVSIKESPIKNFYYTELWLCGVPSDILSHDLVIVCWKKKTYWKCFTWKDVSIETGLT